jgi:hypothetical protein
MTNQLSFPSPNKRYKAVLSYLGEIEPDHGYYSLSVSGFTSAFENRVFGRVCMWSPESRFLAVQEWNETAKAAPPKYYVLLILDVLTKRQCVISNMEGIKGNILPEGFIGESLMYTVLYYGPFGITKNFESRFQYLDGWENLK